MSSGSFNNLSSLSKLLSSRGNEAERLIEHSPEASAVQFRKWVEIALGFMERKHSIPQLPVTQQGKGAIAKRIYRLKEYVTTVTDLELAAMDFIREMGNIAAHKTDDFPRAKAEEVKHNALVVRDWLQKNYIAWPLNSQPGRPPNFLPVDKPLRENRSADIRNGANRLDVTAWPKATLGESASAVALTFVEERQPFPTKIRYWRKVAASTLPVLLAIAALTGTLLIAQSQTKSSLFSKFELFPGGSPPRLIPGSMCSAGQIATSKGCFNIPKGSVDFELSQGDLFLLPVGQQGMLTVISGGIFVKHLPQDSLEYVGAGRRTIVFSEYLLKAEVNGTRAEFRPDPVEPFSNPPPRKTFESRGSNSDLPRASQDESLSTLLAAANKGDPSAQNSLGVMFHMGWNTAQNDFEAVKWFRRAADQGYASSQTWLGTMYRNGWGLPQNELEARKFYSLAAQQGNSFAKRALVDPNYNKR